jgi:hypothetical protein
MEEAISTDNDWKDKKGPSSKGSYVSSTILPQQSLIVMNN